MSHDKLRAAHITVHKGGILMETLMDIGSEISVINASTVRQAQMLQIRPIQETREIPLADGLHRDIRARHPPN